MLDMRIQQHFIDSADLQYQLGEALTRPLGAAVQAVVAGVTGGGKLLVAGLGPSQALAQYLVSLLVGGFERERPGLPAVGLMVDPLMATSGEPAQVLSRQVHALGLAGDVLVLVADSAQQAEFGAAIDAAHARDMSVILLSAAGGTVASALRETDVLVAVPHERAARVREVQLLALHCLCDGIDTHLLGEQELT